VRRLRSTTGTYMTAPHLLSVGRGRPFFPAGGIKIIYDLLLYRSFATVGPPEECG